MKDKIKKISTKLIVMAIISIIFLLVMISENPEQNQYLNHIDYNVVMNNDGSMRVTETWDININKTNTLVRNFNLSLFKYGEINNVKIRDLETGEYLEEIMVEMYHVPDEKFYALKLRSGKFEIAWGTGLEYSKGNRKYEISYDVEDVVTDYKDCQEIYWQFLAEGQNSIPANKVTGKLILPDEVLENNKLRVWGHGQLNGKIEKVNNSEVKFEMENLRPGSMFEIRVITEEKMFNVSSYKTRNYSYLKTALVEERCWAEEANEEAESLNNFYKIFFIIYGICIIVQIIKIIKYIKILKNEDDSIKKLDLKYFRDIPREETATPGEATYLYNFHKERLDAQDIQAKAISATILDLCLKRKIALKVLQDDVYVSMLNENNIKLNKDEEIILKLLKKAGKNQEEFNIKELNSFAKKKYNEYSIDINNFVKEIRNNLYELKLIDKAEEKFYKKCESAETKHVWIYNIYLWLIINHIISYIPFFRQGIAIGFGMGFQDTITNLLAIAFPMVSILIYKYKIQSKIGNKIAVLTQQGSDEKTQWKALAKFMKNYSLLKEKEIVDLVMWERYLVYATAFGISEKVIEEMKANYPEVFIKENWNDEEMKEKYPIIHFVNNPYITYNVVSNSRITRIDTISNNVSKAYKTSMSEIRAHSSSSGSGGGGGFSGGGGGRWRSVAGMGGR